MSSSETSMSTWKVQVWFRFQLKARCELSRFILDLSDVLASGASPSALKRLKFSQSALIMHFDTDKKISPIKSLYHRQSDNYH